MGPGLNHRGLGFGSSVSFHGGVKFEVGPEPKP
jgi:hypothetical protein